jgi:hypothetical protein
LCKAAFVKKSLATDAGLSVVMPNTFHDPDDMFSPSKDLELIINKAETAGPAFALARRAIPKNSLEVTQSGFRLGSGPINFIDSRFL